MADDKKPTVDFLNEISREEPFKEEIVEEKVEDVPEEDKPLPFHKDPKVQRYVDKQIEKALKDRPSAEQQFRKEVDEEINLPTSFIKLVGNDTPEKKEVLQDLSKYFGTLKGEAKKEAWEEMQQRAAEAQQQALEEDKKAQDELDTAFEEIEENYNVDLSSNSANAKKMRSEFIEYVRKIAPKNDEGEVAGFPDLIASFEDFQERTKRPSASRAKELASRGLTRSTDTTEMPTRGNSWKDVDRYFSKLKDSS